MPLAHPGTGGATGGDVGDPAGRELFARVLLRQYRVQNTGQFPENRNQASHKYYMSSHPQKGKQRVMGDNF
jgi:hypothetical protein